MPGPPLESKNAQASDKHYSSENSSSSRKHPSAIIESRVGSQQKIYQPHSPIYPRDDVTPVKRYETPTIDRNFPDVNRRGGNNIIGEYHSHSVGGTPISPRARQHLHQHQRQSLIQLQNQQQQLQQHHHQTSSQQYNHKQKSNQVVQKYRREDIDVRKFEIGLENLGNTCFMNSTLQCLLHIQPLVEYFLEGKIENDLNSQSPKKGMLATSFYHLVREVFNGKSGSVVAPVNFQRAVGVFAPYLMDFQQQDSQEFLRFLLDGIAEDLCRRKQDPPPKSNNQNSPPASTSSTPARSKSNSILPVLPSATKSPERNENVSQNVIQGREKLSSIIKLRNETRVMREQIDSQDDGNKSENKDSNQGSPIEVPQSKLRIVKDIQRARQQAIAQEPNHSDEDEVSESVPNSARSKSTFTQMREAFTGKRLRRSKPSTEGEQQQNNNESTGRERRGSDSSVNNVAKIVESPDDILGIEKAAIKSWEGYMKLNDSIITDLFGGLLQSTIQCTTCHYRSHTFDPFLDLSVPISRETDGSARGLFGSIRQVTGDNKSTLEKCLEKFTGEEILDGDNMYKCEKCKKNRKCTKRLQIYRYPKVLVIHIKRFRFNSTSREKLSTDVHFPLSGLDLRPYVSADLQSIQATKLTPAPSNNNQADEQSPPTTIQQQRILSQTSFNQNQEKINPQLAMTFPTSDPIPSNASASTNNVSDLHCNSKMTPVYDLIGVSNHHGTLNGGHYIAHVDTTYGSSKGQSPRWMCFNDSRVSLANANSISGPTAYVLFYKLRDDRQPSEILTN